MAYHSEPTLKRATPRLAVAGAMLGLFGLPTGTHAEEPAPPIVTVAAKKEAVVKKLDKTVYDVASMPKAANGSAQDLLQATPGVAVTADGQISVKGSTQVTVLIDGRPTAMLAGDERTVALQTMSGAAIASVEVITNPSAAHQANGGAILNIVLKRNRKPGRYAQLQGSAADHGLWNIGAAADMTSGTLSVHGNLAFRHDGTKKVRQSAIDWNNAVAGETGHMGQTSEVFVRRTVESASLGVDYALGDHDSLSLSWRYNNRHSRPLFDTLNVVRTGDKQDIYHRISFGPNKQSDDSASLGYIHQGNGSTLKAMLQHSNTRGLIDKSFRDVYLAPERATAYSHGASQSSRDLNQATLDWSRASESGQWGMGLDFQDKVDKLHNYQATVDPVSVSEVRDPATTNGYTVTTTLTAAYLTDQITRGNWAWLLGGRAEQTKLKVGRGQGGEQSAHRQAFNPSLHLKYAASAHADLTLSFRRSLQMPDPRDLNPFTTYVDAQNLSRGNPALRPQILNAWEIGSDVDAGSVSGSLGAFYRNSRDTVTDARSFADRVLITSKQNGGRARSTGVTTALDWTVDAALQLGVDGGIYYVSLVTPDLAGMVRQDGAAAYLNCKAAYKAGADEVALDAHVQSSGLTPLGRYGATSSVNMTWKRRLNKTLSLTVNANDIFDGSRRRYRTDTSTFRQAGFEHFVAQRVYVGFVKRFE